MNKTELHWNVAYNFADFIRDSRKKCKTREEFISRTINELKKINDRSTEQQFHLDKQAYFKRIEGARFAAITNSFPVPDKYNDELRNLLDRLS